ncbi:hypothetical protein GQ42DRAFT_164553 [Ramicandelaber brevisporus]|nr:hypothetical protein GQ42DRAFT_164553 [Ramicandelaber brevisporus]
MAIAIVATLPLVHFSGSVKMLPLVSRPSDNCRSVAAAATVATVAAVATSSGRIRARAQTLDATKVSELLLFAKLAKASHSRLAKLRQLLAINNTPSITEAPTADIDSVAISKPVVSYLGQVTGPRRCILYLEPTPGSPVDRALRDFFATAEACFGPNEASMYHPHVSLTGFMDVADGVGYTSGDAMGLILHLADKTLSDHSARLHNIDQSTVATATAATATAVNKFALGTPQIRDLHTSKVVLPLHITDAVRNVAADIISKINSASRTLSTAVSASISTSTSTKPQILARSKPMTSVSLSYFDKHVHTDYRYPENNIHRMEWLAQQRLSVDGIIARATASSKPVDTRLGHNKHCLSKSTSAVVEQGWDIVLYEQTNRARSLGQHHRFLELGRWSAGCSLLTSSSSYSPSSLSTSSV